MKKKWIVGSFVPLIAVGLVGCGGGGGGGGAPQSSFTINGTVLNGDNSPAANDKVLFDNSNIVSLQATTDNDGQYTIVVPSGRVTGNDKLWITDASANVLDVAPIVVNATPLTPTTTLPNSPPAQPPSI